MASDLQWTEVEAGNSCAVSGEIHNQGNQKVDLMGIFSSSWKEGSIICMVVAFDNLLM